MEHSVEQGMAYSDDELIEFEAHGASLPAGGTPFVVETGGATIHGVRFGHGPPVILLHGGMGHGGNFAHQVPALLGAGFSAIVIDSRGHGRSTRDSRPYSYWLLADDVRAVMDTLGIPKAAIVGWSDGADTGLVLAHDTPERVSSLLFFACNVDDSGTLPFEMTPVIGRCIARHQLDYQALSATPEDFDAFAEAVGKMQRTEPDYSADDLAAIRVPVLSVLGEHDEFIRRSHAGYIAQAIPGAQFVLLKGVSHFAPLQRPDVFNAVMLDWLQAGA